MTTKELSFFLKIPISKIICFFTRQFYMMTCEFMFKRDTFDHIYKGIVIQYIHVKGIYSTYFWVLLKLQR